MATMYVPDRKRAHIRLGQNRTSWRGLPDLLRETRPMHREKPHKLLQVGVTPTPATNYIWEMIRLPDCKSGVAK
jgi:hypothetical protein